MAPCGPLSPLPRKRGGGERGRCRQAARKLGMTGPGSKEKSSGPRRGSGLFLFDVVDDLGHVILVLAEFGGILDQLLLLLLGLFERDGLRLRLLVLDRFHLLDFDIGIDLLAADRFEFLGDRRRRPRPARPQQRLGIERRAAFRADRRVAQQIVVARAAARADTLGAPFGFGHRRLLIGSGVRRYSVVVVESGGRAIATTATACQK